MTGASLAVRLESSNIQRYGAEQIAFILQSGADKVTTVMLTAISLRFLYALKSIPAY